MIMIMQPSDEDRSPYPENSSSSSVSVTVSTVFYPGADVPFAQDVVCLSPILEWKQVY